MLYLLHGTDRQKVLARAGTIVEGLKKRKADAEVFTLGYEEVKLGKLQEFSGGQGLFQNKYIVLLKSAFTNKDIADDLVKLLPALAASPNIFIFAEGGLTKPILAAFSKAPSEATEYNLPVTGKKETPFNMFSLADAAGERNRKNAWVLYQKALRQDASPEELSGIIFWQIKSIMSAATGSSPAASGLSPFVFQKAKRYAKNFTSDEINARARNLVSLYHDAHRGLVDFETGLEGFLLNL